MKIEMVMVRDCDGNELYLTDNICKACNWCHACNVDGSNGEYLAFGYFNPDMKSFEAFDYREIDIYTIELYGDYNK